VRSLDRFPERRITLPVWPLKTIIALSDSDVWLVGGAVRDLLLGRSLRDWDFVVDRDAIRLARAVANAMDGAFYALDADRGTGRAIVADPQTARQLALDFAEMRGSTLEQDLQHRDFTINAMALTLSGRLIDPTGGQEDLARGIIRLTHPGALRQDPARLVRAVRIATELNFDLAPETQAQIRADTSTVQYAATERIRDELIKLFSSAAASRGLALLCDLQLLTHVLPDIPMACLPPTAAARTRAGVLLSLTGALVGTADTAEGVMSAPVAADLKTILEKFDTHLSRYVATPLDAGLTRRDLAMWCPLFLSARDVDVDEPTASRNTTAGRSCIAARAERQLTALRFSSRAQTFVVRTLQEMGRFAALCDRMQLDNLDAHRRELHRYFRATAEAGVLSALLCSAEQQIDRTKETTSSTTWAVTLNTLHAVLTAYFHLYDEIVDPRPLLNGTDLLRMGFAQGPALGSALVRLREAQAAGEINTVTEAQDWVKTLVGH
jgi:poly(A) polymerase